MESSSYKTTPYSNSIQVVWDNSSNQYSNYMIKYRVSSQGADFADLKTKINEGEIDSLVSNTQYDINVYYVDDDGDNHSMFKTTCKTTEATDNELKKCCDRAADEPGRPTVYHFRAIHKDKIPVQKDRNESDVIYVNDIIAEYGPSTTTCAEKNILMLGATGTGKSTLIESLINYLTDVSYSDDHRFSTISKSDDERQRILHQHESQTTSVTLYRIPDRKDLKGDCRVNIIDTPGFNDTRNSTEGDGNNKLYDKRIEIQIKYLLEHIIEHLDAIVIVVPMGETRLTDDQTHIFSSIVKLFGNDVEKNVLIAMTKDDGGAPDCLNVIRAAGIPFAESFRFNNSNVFTKDSPETDAIIWRRRKATFDSLFKYLETAPKTGVQTSVDVMNARLGLQLQLEALKDKLSELTQEVASANVNPEKETECVVPVAEYERQYTGKTSMNCKICQKTCHEKCWVPLNMFKRTCEIFNRNGCSICDNKCDTGKHIREKFIYKLKYVNKAFADEAALKKNIQSKPPKDSLRQFQLTIAKIEGLLKELEKKALKHCVMSTDQYIQELIDREKRDNQAGYQSRVNVLENVIMHLQTGKSIGTLQFESLTI